MPNPFNCAKWHIRSSTLSCQRISHGTGVSFSGFTQTTMTQNRRWSGTFILNPLSGEDYLEYRGWLGSIGGAGVPFDMCLCDPFTVKAASLTKLEWAMQFSGLTEAELCGPTANGEYGLPHSDGTCFSDGSGYYIPPFTPNPTVSLAATIGSTQITTSGAAQLKVGNRFSTTDNYLHQVEDVNGGVVTFHPPLRRALTAGETIETENPKIKVMLANDTTGVPNVEFARRTSEISLSVVEVMDR